MRALACAALMSAVVVAGQAPQFEVASIRPSAEQLDRGDFEVHVSGAQVRISQLTLRDYVALAYGRPRDRVVAPDWTTHARFDIAAKLADGVSAERVPEMLQQLFADRFALKTHRESKEFNVYALVVRKEGLTLPESRARPGEPDVNATPGGVSIRFSGSGAGLKSDFGDGSFFTFANNRLEITRATMTSIAETLSQLLAKPVIDATGLTARYDLAFTVTPQEYQGLLVQAALNHGVSPQARALGALDAVANEPLSARLQPFGLQLEPRKAPLDVIVIDSMRRTPTDN
jgi:uncharacterized protein (TIGR03435 family)